MAGLNYAAQKKYAHSQADGRPCQKVPVERLIIGYAGGIHSAPLNILDYMQGNLRVGFSPEFKILAAAGQGNLLERHAVKRRQNIAGGYQLAGKRPDADGIHGYILFMGCGDGLSQFAALGLAVGNYDNPLGVMAFTEQLPVLFQNLEAP